jgi:hypothetical protein
MSLAGGKLHVGPASRLSDGLRKRIHSHKLEIVAELQRQAATAALPCPADVAERAALTAHSDHCDATTYLPPMASVWI